MFNQVDLELKPSIRVAVLLSMPCIATLILILTAQIPVIILILLACLHLILSYHFISKIALLSSSASIKSIHISKENIYLEDKSGQVYIATPHGKNIIHPTFSLLSFDCKQLNNSSAQPGDRQDKFQLEQHSSTEIIPTDYINQTTGFYQRKLPTSILNFFRTAFLFKNRRHLFICGYNASNSSAFRRVRVWLRFNL